MYGKGGAPVFCSGINFAGLFTIGAGLIKEDECFIICN